MTLYTVWGVVVYIRLEEWMLAYWQVMLYPDDKDVTAFTTDDELWPFNVIPFELRNTPATFETHVCSTAGLKLEDLSGIPRRLNFRSPLFCGICNLRGIKKKQDDSTLPAVGWHGWEIQHNSGDKSKTIRKCTSDSLGPSHPFISAGMPSRYPWDIWKNASQPVWQGARATSWPQLWTYWERTPVARTFTSRSYRSEVEDQVWEWLAATRRARGALVEKEIGYGSTTPLVGKCETRNCNSPRKDVPGSGQDKRRCLSHTEEWPDQKESGVHRLPMKVASIALVGTMMSYAPLW